MDSNNNSMAADWRTELLPEFRHHLVTKITEMVKGHMPFSGPEPDGFVELRKMAATRFEEKVYSAASSQSDYLRQISLKMLMLESRNKNPPDPGTPYPIERKEEEGVESYISTLATTSSTNSEGTSQKGKRKRGTDNMESFREAAMIICNKIDEATEKFSRAIGVDLDIANKRYKINEELRNHCGNLERAERHKALIAIARDHEMTDIFFTLENDEKEDFVRALLSGGL